MDKQEFNKLDVFDQLTYINNELMNGESLRSISATLKMSKTTFRDRFTKIGYTFNADQHQYIKDNSIVVKNECKHITSILQECKTPDKKPANESEYKSNMIVFNSNEQHKMMDILGNYDKLKELISWFDTQKNIVEVQELKIDAARLKGEVKTTTVRLYSDVWEEFKKFAEGFKEFKNQDLVTTALLEFMDKYRK